MYLGYNTNGLAHHRLEDAICLLAEIGYQGVAITIDHGALSPNSSTLEADLERIGNLLVKRRMHCVVETAARYLLDYRKKHFPTLISASPIDRQRRVAFLEHAIHVAHALEADCVSLWSGAADDSADEEECFARLTEGLLPLANSAREKGLKLAFEPEPGMFIDTMVRFEQLLHRLSSTHLALTLDLGHLHCQGEIPMESHIAHNAQILRNVHIEDMRRGVHEHLMFGEGEMNIPSVINALAKSNYQGGVFVELSRHSHMGPEAAKRAFEYLQPLADWKV